VHALHQNIDTKSCTKGNVRAEEQWRCRDMGKSGVTTSRLCHAGNARKACRAPCHETWGAGVDIRGAMATSEKKTCFNAGKIEFCHCAAILQTQIPKLCTNLDLSLLYILI